MPVVSRFFGISIRMFYADHAPPHFHARYGEHEALIAIGDLRVLRGRLPPRAMALTIEWALKHRNALVEDWSLARDHRPLKAIPPLM